MSVIILLIIASLIVGLIFLGAFIWSVRTGQYEDTLTPAMRMLLDDTQPQPPFSRSNSVSLNARPHPDPLPRGEGTCNGASGKPLSGEFHPKRDIFSFSLGRSGADHRPGMRASVFSISSFQLRQTRTKSRRQAAPLPAVDQIPGAAPTPK